MHDSAIEVAAGEGLALCPRAILRMVDENLHLWFGNLVGSADNCRLDSSFDGSGVGPCRALDPDAARVADMVTSTDAASATDHVCGVGERGRDRSVFGGAPFGAVDQHGVAPEDGFLKAMGLGSGVCQPSRGHV